MKKLYILFLFSLLLLLYSCAGDCKEETIEKVEWITQYVDQSVDTLVHYSVTYNSNYTYQEATKKVTITNNNDKYSNKFAISVSYGYVDYYDEDKTNYYQSDYVSIPPHSSQVFTFSSQATKTHNFNYTIHVLQISERITVKKRKDELKTEQIKVNNCEQNIEALKEKYASIKELFNEKVKSKSSSDIERYEIITAVDSTTAVK